MVNVVEKTKFRKTENEQQEQELESGLIISLTEDEEKKEETKIDQENIITDLQDGTIMDVGNIISIEYTKPTKEYIQSIEEKIKKTKKEIINSMKERISKEAHIMYVIFTKNSDEKFYKVFVKILPLIHDKLEKSIENELLEYFSEFKSDDFKSIRSKIVKEILDEIIKNDLSVNGFIGIIISEIQKVYRAGQKKREKGILKSRTKEELKEFELVKNNIRYLFGKEGIDMSYENLRKILLKYLK